MDLARDPMTIETRKITRRTTSTVGQDIVRIPIIQH
jgi:hypothetical protein